MANNLDRKNNEDKVILDNHITRYLDAVGKTMLITEAAILVSTIIIVILIAKGIYPYTIHTRFNVPLAVYFKEQFAHKIIAWTIIASYFFFSRNLRVRSKKNFFCTVIVILTALLVFGSWNVNYFGFLFIIPVIVASPLSKRTSKVILFTTLFLDACYAIMQAYLRQDKYNYLMGVITITIILAFYFLGQSIHKTMYSTLLDVKQYTVISKNLYEEVSHDYLTGAFSVSALHNDLAEDNDHNYKSLAFIDVDNFKSINDKYGHDTGDYILKLLVTVTENYELFIYRYGGDEFVIISESSSNDLVKDLQEIKDEFTRASSDLYNCKATLSIGVINIVGKEKLFEYLKQCDKLMYISKNSGKNKITVEDNSKSVIDY